MENQTQPQQLDTYELNFDVLLNKTVSFKAKDEDEAIGKLEKLLDEKEIPRAHLSNLNFRVVKAK